MALKLRYLLAGAFIAVAIVPVVFLGFWVERTAYMNEVGQVREKHLLLATNITAALERYAHDSRAVFDHFVAMAEGASAHHDFADFASSLGFRHFCIFDDDGNVSFVLEHALSAEARLPAALLAKLRPYIGDETRFTEVMRDSHGRPTIYLVRRLGPGRIALGALSTDYIVSLQRKITFGRKGHAAIVDRSGNVIAHPRADWQQGIKNIAGVEPVRRMMAGETGVTTFFSPAIGKDMITGYTSAPDTGWGVMVPQPLEELLERARNFELYALMIAVLGLATAAMIGWFLAGYLTRPIDAVVNTARDIAKGKLDRRVGSQPGLVPNEFSALADDFNAMAEKIQRNQELMGEALHDAQTADKTKAEFLANISHELRTPLNAIIGFSEAIAHDLVGADSAERHRAYAADIHQAGTQLLTVINDILDLSRIEAGDVEISDDMVDLRRMAEGVVRGLDERAQCGGVAVAFECADSLPAVLGSEAKLKQILVNLLSNAIKFTSAGGQVRVSLIRDGDDGDGVIMRVSDTGIGMSEDDVRVALQPFRQIDGRMSRKYEGTGLGLPLAQRLAELHGASFEIVSAPGEGTEITVRFAPDKVVAVAA